MAIAKIHKWFTSCKSKLEMDDYYYYRFPVQVIKLMDWMHSKTMSDMLHYQLGRPRIAFIKAIIKHYHASYDKETGAQKICDPVEVQLIFEAENKEAYKWDRLIIHGKRKHGAHLEQKRFKKQ